MIFRNIKSVFQKIWWFGPYLPMSQLLLAVFGRYLPVGITQKIVIQRNKKIQGLLRNFIDDNIDIKILTEPACDDKPTKNIIWVCWLQGEQKMTELSKICFESVKRHSGEADVILLTEKNLEQYVKLPPIITQRYNEGNIKPAHYADIIRINILAQQGGLWLDATMLATKPIPEEIFESEFWTVKIPEFGNYISRCRWSVFALYAKKNNTLFETLARIFTVYFEKYPIMIDYFMFDHLINILYEDFVTIREMIDKVPPNNKDVYKLKSLKIIDNEHVSLDSVKNDTFLFKLSNKH